MAQLHCKHVALTILLTLAGFAAGAADSLRVSLLTCSPGTEVWSQYGHTAIRVQNFTSGADVTFNYGLFDFSSPHFIWRFCTGETDYLVAGTSTQWFLQGYAEEGRSVTEQELDLTPEAREAITGALVVNCLPENRTYRYNFFYDNCATRVRHMVEDHCGELIDYRTEPVFGTLRDALKYYTRNYPWSGFGISLLIAAPADRPSGFEEEMFAPEVMMEGFATAMIGERPLVSDTCVLVEKDPSKVPASLPLPSPQLCFWALFAAVLAATVVGLYKGRQLRWIDIALMLLLGVAGVILFFFNFFSAHPATSPNWLLTWANPLALVLGVMLCFRSFRNSRAASLLLALWLLPLAAGAVAWIAGVQYFHPALLPLMLSVAARSAVCIPGLLNSRKA